MGETWILMTCNDGFVEKRKCYGVDIQGGVKREGEREQSAPREPPALVKKPKLSTSPK